jgi:hypothetical protein
MGGKGIVRFVPQCSRGLEQSKPQQNQGVISIYIYIVLLFYYYYYYKGDFFYIFIVLQCIVFFFVYILWQRTPRTPEHWNNTKNYHATPL